MAFVDRSKGLRIVLVELVSVLCCLKRLKMQLKITDLGNLKTRYTLCI